MGNAGIYSNLAEQSSHNDRVAHLGFYLRNNSLRESSPSYIFLNFYQAVLLRYLMLKITNFVKTWRSRLNFFPEKKKKNPKFIRIRLLILHLYCLPLFLYLSFFYHLFLCQLFITHNEFTINSKDKRGAYHRRTGVVIFHCEYIYIRAWCSKRLETNEPD